MAYLDAMGVAMYVPRRVLPGAAPSVQARLPAPEPGAAVNTGRAGVVDASTGVAVPPARVPPNTSSARADTSARRVDSLFESLAVPVSTDAARAAATAAATPSIASVSTASVTPERRSVPVAFALSLWRASERLLVIDSRRSREALPTQALLDNLLRAKGVPSPGMPEVLRWPPAPGPAVFGAVQLDEWGAAKEMVMAFLQARLDQQGAAYILVMGETAFRLLFDEAVEGFEQASGRALSCPALSALALVTPSLADMLQTPSLKARAWTSVAAYDLRG